MRISEAAKAAGVGVETIRFYERKGLVDRPKRPVMGGGFRFYPGETVERIRFIRQAQEIGFSLREIKEFLTGKGLSFAAGDGTAAAGDGEGGAVSSDPMQRPLSEFEWSGRVLNIIQALGIDTIGQLAQRTKSELLSMKNVGRTSIDEIDKCLATFGVSLQE